MAPVRGTMRQAGRSLSCITSAGADGQRDAPVIVRHRNISGAKRTKEKKLEEINETEGERTGGEKGSIGMVGKKRNQNGRKIMVDRKKETKSQKRKKEGKEE